MKNRNLFIVQISLMIVAWVLLLIDATNVEGVILAVATVGGQYSPDMQAFRRNLEKKVGKEVWVRGKMGKLTGLIDFELYKKTGELGAMKNSIPLDQAIIHKIQDFTKNKGQVIDIPITRPLTGVGRTGSASLSGHSERKKVFYKNCQINMKRHAMLERDNEMSEQVLPEEIVATLIRNGAAELKDWFSRLMPFEALFAVLVGSSNNLHDSSWGTGVSMKSHPNLYVQGDGQVLFASSVGTHVANTFDSGYEVNVATALATLSKTSEADWFSSQSIRNMTYLARQHKIQQISYEGQLVDVIFVSSAQIRQLRRDEDWLRAQHDAATRGKSNQIFTGAMEAYLYEGAILIVDDSIPAARITGDTDFSATYSTNSASTGVQYYLPGFMETPRDTHYRKPAILVGAGAILVAEGRGFKFTQEITDHEQQIEDGGRMIYGMTRSDITDVDNYLGNGANLFYGNHGSLVYFTASPDEITI